MDILNGLAQLLGLNKSPAPSQQKPQQATQRPLIPQLPEQYAQYMNADGSGGGFGPNNPSQVGQAVHKGQEDDGLVNTPNGPVPLSSLNQGQKWQNPQNGYSPNGYAAGTDARTAPATNNAYASPALGALYSLLNR